MQKQCNVSFITCFLYLSRDTTNFSTFIVINIIQGILVEVESYIQAQPLITLV
jgi:hypothetical protein